MTWQARAEKAEADKRALEQALEEIARHKVPNARSAQAARAVLERVQRKA